jgi:drug/metabolite transporter (DMT)-like permease
MPGGSAEGSAPDGRLLLAYAALTGAVLFWSGNVVTGRALRDAVDPIALNLYRWTIAGILLAPFGARAVWSSRAALLRAWPVVVGLAVTGLAGFQTCVYVAVRHTEAVSALLVLQLAPVVITLGARLIFGDRITPGRALGMLIAAVGALVLIGRGDPLDALRLELNRGDAVMILAVLLWAGYSLLLKHRPEVPQMALLGATILVGLLILVPAWLITGGPAARPPLPPVAIGGVLYIGVFASFLAFLFWNTGVARVGPGRASVFMYLMPLFGALLGYLVLGETIALFHLVGAVLVFGGIGVMNRF